MASVEAAPSAGVPARGPDGTTTPAVGEAADVTDYRGDVSRRGLMPGPGPSSAPVVLWRYEDPSGIGVPPAVAAGQVLVPKNASLVASIVGVVLVAVFMIEVL